jgi:hypothetical protein
LNFGFYISTSIITLNNFQKNDEYSTTGLVFTGAEVQPDQRKSGKAEDTKRGNISANWGHHHGGKWLY